MKVPVNVPVGQMKVQMNVHNGQMKAQMNVHNGLMKVLVNVQSGGVVVTGTHSGIVSLNGFAKAGTGWRSGYVRPGTG